MKALRLPACCPQAAALPLFLSSITAVTPLSAATSFLSVVSHVLNNSITISCVHIHALQLF